MGRSKYDPDSPAYWDKERKDRKTYWEKMKSVHPRLNIETPELLWQLACDYFAKVDNEKAMIHQLVKGGNLAGKLIPIPTEQPYTWQAFEVFLREKEIISSLQAYKTNKDGRYDDYQPVIRDIGNVIFQKNFNGAATGELDAGIITRQLSLANKEETTVVAEQRLFTEDEASPSD